MSNPFAAGIYAGRQTYHTTVEERIYAVFKFDRSQCEAALQLVGLQKTVAKAIHRRVRHLDKLAVRLHFEDHGQDFLWWDLDHAGKVIDANLQVSIWKGCSVLAVDKLRKGSIVHYERDGVGKSIRYPLTKVERLKPASGAAK